MLIVEDSQETVFVLKESFTQNGFLVDVAEDGREGSKKAGDSQYDIVILDINLPYRNGKEICSEIRQRGDKVPIIMLSAEIDPEIKVGCFDIGANDYVTKPYSFEELNARVEVQLRDHQEGVQKEEPLLKYRDLKLNIGDPTVKRGAKQIKLTAKEHALLRCLMENAGAICSKEMLLREVWKEEDCDTKTLEAHMCRLRKKIKQKGKSDFIRTINGFGYRIK